VAPPPAAPTEKIFDVWASSNTEWADLEARSDLPDQKFTKWGFILGADMRIGDHWIAGAFAQYDRIWADLDKQGSRADIDAGGGGIYAGYQNCGWYGHGLFDYTHNWYESNRNIEVPLDFIFKDTQLGETQGNMYGFDVDGGYDWCLFGSREAPPPPPAYSKDGGKNVKNVVPGAPPPAPSNFTVGLLAGLQYVHDEVDSFNETEGSNNTRFCPGDVCPEIPGASLHVGEQNLDSLRTRLGGRAVYHLWNCDGWAFAAEARAAWQHEFLDDSHTLSGSLIGEGLHSFNVQTTAPQRDSALVGGGLNVTWKNRYTIFGDYDADVGAHDFTAQTVKGGAKISF
jgi:uncharacterized protein with beta-barrel porin domain